MKTFLVHRIVETIMNGLHVLLSIQLNYQYMKTNHPKIHILSNDLEATVEVKDATLISLPLDMFPDPVDPSKDLIRYGDAHRP